MLIDHKYDHGDVNLMFTDDGKYVIVPIGVGQMSHENELEAVDD